MQIQTLGYRDDSLFSFLLTFLYYLPFYYTLLLLSLTLSLQKDFQADASFLCVPASFLRQELIPLILCTACLHPEPKERDQLLHILFNLIKRPDDDQR